MCDNKLIAKLANVPLARPGFDALSMTAPVLVQLNPNGKWENSKPECLEEEQLKAVVQHLMKTNAVSAAQSYCCQCAAESQKDGGRKGQSNFVPIIMMPISAADQCPFDMECEIQKMKESKPKPSTKVTQAEKVQDADKDKDRKKKKRGFVMQRLTDFDLLSQW